MNMKKILLLSVLVCNLFALGGMDSLPNDEKEVATRLKEVLELNEKDAFKLYTNYFQSYLNSQKWQIHYYDNNDPANTKVNNSPDKGMYVSIINDSRLVNIAVTKYAKKSQLFIYSVETLPRKSSIALEKFEELKKDTEWEKDRESEHFAYFTRDGYMQKINIFVSSPVSAVQYVDLYTFDLTD